MSGICEGRVVIVTGAGRGIGREHALEFGHQGAKVVVNDIGTELDGSGGSTGPAGEVVEAIRAMGGEAMAHGADVTNWEQTGDMVMPSKHSAASTLLVNNAGFVRNRMFGEHASEEWDAIINVHLKGHFCTTRHAAAYQLQKAKRAKKSTHASSTPAVQALLGSVGQSNYSAAKAGIASLTLVQAS